MRVLVLHSELGVLRGGGENFTRNLFTAFAARGHRVAAAFTADPRARYPLSLPPSIDAIPIPGWWSRKFGQGLFSRVGRWMPSRTRAGQEWERIRNAASWRAVRWHDRRFQRRVEQRFRVNWGDFDAVYVHGNCLLASCVARCRPTVLRLPGPVAEDVAPALRAVHAVCANGDALNRIRAFLGDDAIELPVGVDDRMFAPGPSSIRSVLGWTDRHVVLGYVGRLTHVKGVDLLARAFRQCVKSHANVRLLIVGDGEERGTIRAELNREIGHGCVHIESDIEPGRLPEWYRAMDLLVMPSRYENFSNAVLEGMACGVPVAASDIGGNRVVGESGAGWLFDPESVPSLERCLSAIVSDGTALKVRGAAASAYVRERFSWNESARRLEEIIQSRLRVLAA